MGYARSKSGRLGLSGRLGRAFSNTVLDCPRSAISGEFYKHRSRIVERALIVDRCALRVARCLRAYLVGALPFAVAHGIFIDWRKKTGLRRLWWVVGFLSYEAIYVHRVTVEQ